MSSFTRWTGLREHLQDTSKFHGRNNGFLLVFKTNPNDLPIKMAIQPILGGSQAPVAPCFQEVVIDVPNDFQGVIMEDGAQKDGGSYDDEDDKNDDEDDDTCLTIVIMTIE